MEPKKLLFDPNTYKTGVVMTIEAIVPSWDGKHVAMGISSGGAEYSEIRILNGRSRSFAAGKHVSLFGADRLDQR
jgi:hypothetical protein